MLSWLVLLVGALLVLAFLSQQRRNPSPGSWVGALMIIGVVVWVSSLVQPEPEVAAPAVETTSVPTPAAQQRPSPFNENAARGGGVPMTP